MGFPGGSVGKASDCNAGDLGLIPGSDPWVRKIPLEKGMATHSSILTWRIPMDRGDWQAAVHGITESDMTEQLTLSLHFFPFTS